MLEDQEFENEFYLNQIKLMEYRYSVVFRKKFKLSWDKYYGNVVEKLHNKTYWIWVYLCGLEKFIQETEQEPKKLKIIEKDCQDRIFRITKGYSEIQTYVRNL